MLDIGTKADDYALTKLYKYMLNNQMCGGCCGEIEVDFSNHKDGFNASYLIKSAQFYEYKLSHSPDKACESFFGYNSVLPGAYCMFRWKAIQGGPMDKFFKLVNSNADPTCPEANEYLAEDRVMCLQIYIKEKAGYYLTFIPDAKAFTDAPENLTILIKQRRRWMNGALFAAFRVIQNCQNMTRCKRTKHSMCRQALMFVYMLYFITMQVLTFFLLGSFFVSIKLFFKNYFKQITDKETFKINNYDMWYFFNGDGSLTFVSIFSYLYIGMLVVSLLGSITMPVDRAIYYFRFVATVMCILTIISLIGISVFLSDSGFYPQTKIYDSTNMIWYNAPNDEHHFSVLTLCGMIMLAIFLLPMLMRPLDFIENFP